MLRDYISADAFKSGIVQYLQKYSYRNTRNEDLWNSMASVSMVWFSLCLGDYQAYYHVLFSYTLLILPRRILTVF